MSLNVLNNNEDLNKHKEHMFTNEGYNTLDNYCKNLIKMLNSKPIYPIKQGIILGVPLMKFAQYIISKDDLLGRIKLISQLLGKKEFEIELDEERKIVYNLEGDINDC